MGFFSFVREKARVVFTFASARRTAPAKAGVKIAQTKNKKPVPIGDGFKLLPELDLRYYLQNSACFLVNRGLTQEKRGVSYRVQSFDELTNELVLVSKYGTVFQSKLSIVTPERYVMVIGPADTVDLPERVVYRAQDACSAGHAALS